MILCHFFALGGRFCPQIFLIPPHFGTTGALGLGAPPAPLPPPPHMTQGCGFPSIKSGVEAPGVTQSHGGCPGLVSGGTGSTGMGLGGHWGYWDGTGGGTGSTGGVLEGEEMG